MEEFLGTGAERELFLNPRTGSGGKKLDGEDLLAGVLNAELLEKAKVD